MNLLENKERYLALLRSINREGVDYLADFIEASDFFTAPASTSYHSDFEGGLCKHSLNVYDNVVKLNELYGADLSEDSMKLAALLHDLAKIDFYELNIANKKQYSSSGQQHDSIGNFDYVQKPYYKIKDSVNRSYTFGEHGVVSFIIANKYIKLTDAETAAIINHHGVYAATNKPIEDITEMFQRYPLAAILHLADSASTYLLESRYYVE